MVEMAAVRNSRVKKGLVKHAALPAHLAQHHGNNTMPALVMTWHLHGATNFATRAAVDGLIPPMPVVHPPTPTHPHTHTHKHLNQLPQELRRRGGLRRRRSHPHPAPEAPPQRLVCVWLCSYMHVCGMWLLHTCRHWLLVCATHGLPAHDHLCLHCANKAVFLPRGRQDKGHSHPFGHPLFGQPLFIGAAVRLLAPQAKGHGLLQTLPTRIHCCPCTNQALSAAVHS